MLEQIVHAHRGSLASLTAKLVAQNTEAPPGRGYADCLEWLREELEILGLSATVARVPGGDADPDHPRYYLRAELGSGPRTVYFHGHVDVVPADAPEQFEPKVTKQTVFGRGASDMKGGLASMIFAMVSLRETEVPLDGRIVLTVVPDEEIGGRLGSRALSDAGLLVREEEEPVAMLTAEPTSGVVWHASRGAITCRVEVQGRSAHVGLQHLGSNAFEAMLDVAGRLRELKREVEQRSTGYSIEPAGAARSILMMGGETRGGRNFNVVPDGFTFTVDRRINPEEDFDEERARLLEVIESAGAPVRVDVFQEARPAGVPADVPSALALGRAIEKVRYAPARFELCPGILEIRFYAELGVPAFAYGPGLLRVSHGPKEFVKRRDLEDVALIYAKTAAELLAPDA